MTKTVLIQTWGCPVESSRKGQSGPFWGQNPGQICLAAEFSRSYYPQ